MFAPMTAVRIPGRVAWCNFELARSLGFDVPDWPRMTAALHEQLVGALSYRLLRAGEEAGDRPTITLYADYYGGDGIAPYLGSARAGFLPYGDILLKGIGLTPLFKMPKDDDFPHTHGGCNINEALAEAVHGEVSRNLFSREPARILAIIDQDDWTEYPDGRKLARCILARAGLQLRPAHMLARDAPRRDLFVRLTAESGQLVLRDGAPDLKATMLRVIDDHASAVAEQVRWRITHGCISTSNMLMSGGMLDVVIQCAHPRIADIVPERKDPERVYFRDYLDRVKQMGKIHRALRRSDRTAGYLDEYKVMAAAYRRHLDLTLVRATGLKPRAAELLRDARPELVRRFTDVLIRMAALRNLASFRRSRAKVEHHAVVDILQLLRNHAAVFFGEPEGDHRKRIHAGLRPMYRGNPRHVACKRITVRRLIREFASLYRELMAAAADVAMDCYGSVNAMQRSVVARAAFENVPLDRLYRTQFWEDVDATVARYRETNDPSLLAKLVEERVLASSRNVDALLFGEPATLLDDGIVELNVRYINGRRYAVHVSHEQRIIAITEESGATRSIAAGEPYGILDGYVYAFPDEIELRELYSLTKPGRISSTSFANRIESPLVTTICLR